MTATEPRGAAPEAGGVEMVIDGVPVTARTGELVIAAAERHGVYIPRFCYHPRMSSVGMCRMCLVEIDTGRGPALTPSCMVTVSPGMVVHTESPTSKRAQEGVLEMLLVNHPLDCPVCDKGGECPLQDQTMSHGPGESRFVEEKRHFEKPIPISDLVLLDRERCILCDRCTRFAKEVAGDPLIHFTERGNQTQVLTFPDEPFSSYFSGNTVQICPVGALTAKPYRFKARPWDLEQAESTCTTCSVGCRVVVQSSRNEILRYQGVDVDAVNWGWLCDKGRFGFQAVHSPDRLGAPRVRTGDELTEVTWSEGLAAAAGALQAALDRSGPDGIGVIGGARLTNEDAYAWAKLLKGVIGTDHVDAQLGDGLPAEVVLGLPPATIDDACAAGVCIVLGPDLKDELPVLFLRLRDAAEHRKLKIVEISPTATPLTRHTAVSVRCRPGEEAAVVRTLLGAGNPAAVGLTDDEAARAGALLRPESGDAVVVLGRPSVAASAATVVDAAAALLGALPQARFLVGLRRGNVRGALDLGLAPGVLPGRVTLQAGSSWFADAWGAAPATEGLDTAGILRRAAEGKLACLVLLGADPLNDFADRDLARRALAGAGKVIAIDCLLNDSSAKAHIVLAAAGYAEKAGTTTNLEGRVTTLAQKVTPPGTARPDWMIAAELAWRLGGDLGLESVEQIWDEIERVAPAHAGITRARLATREGSDGVLARGEGGDGQPEVVRFRPPAAPSDLVPLDGYAYRLVSGRKLYDNGVAVHASPALAPLAPGAKLRMHPVDHDRLGLTDGTRVKVSSKRTSAVLAAYADPAVPRGTVAVAFNQPDSSVNELIDVTEPVTDLRVENL